MKQLDVQLAVLCVEFVEPLWWIWLSGARAGTEYDSALCFPVALCYNNHIISSVTAVSVLQNGALLRGFLMG